MSQKQMQSQRNEQQGSQRKKTKKHTKTPLAFSMTKMVIFCDSFIKIRF